MTWSDDLWRFACGDVPFFQEKLGEALKIITRTIHHISHLNVVESQEIKVLMKTFMGRTWRTRGNFKLYDWKCGLLRCNFDLYWEATFHKIASHALHEFPSKFADLYRKWGKFLASIVLFLSLIHIWRCRRSTLCRSRWSPYH